MDFQTHTSINQSLNKTMIAFNYQCTLYFNSAKHCIESIRKFYKDLPIDVYVDETTPRINDYETLCNDHNCDFTFRDRVEGYISRKDPIEVNLSKMLESHHRIYSTCKKYNKEWTLLLEDDVYIKKPIERFPTSDCGKNRHNVSFLGGGSIFKTEAFIKIHEMYGESGLSDIIKSDYIYSWAGDVLKQRIFIDNGYTHEKWVELAEPGYWDDTNFSVYHGYKDLHHLG